MIHFFLGNRQSSTDLRLHVEHESSDRISNQSLSVRELINFFLNSILLIRSFLVELFVRPKRDCSSVKLRSFTVVLVLCLVDNWTAAGLYNTIFTPSAACGRRGRGG